MIRDDVTVAALALYRPPFRYDHGYIWDADRKMVSDEGGTHDAIQRVRGWGLICGKPGAEALQDRVGELVAQALTEFWEKHT